MYETPRNIKDIKKEKKEIFQELTNNKENQDLAIKTFAKEFGINANENEKIIQTKINQAVESPSFFEKIKNNKFLKDALKVILVTFFLLKGEPTFAQKLSSEEIGKKEKIEYLQPKNQKEIYKNVLKEDESIIPKNVMKAFWEVVDKQSVMDVPMGGYLGKNFLNTKEKEETFVKKLKDLNYSQAEIEKFKSLLEAGNKIVFNEEVLNQDNFLEIVAHERLHKKIAELNPTEKQILNKARDSILMDYREKEQKWSASSDSLIQLLKAGQISFEEYNQKLQAKILEANPILLDYKNSASSENIIPILGNKEEFYTYLMMGKLHPQVLDYIKNHFPDAYQIFNQLKNNINLEIQSKINQAM